MKSVRPEIQRVGERNGKNRGMEEKEQSKCSPLLQHIACIWYATLIYKFQSLQAK